MRDEDSLMLTALAERAGIQLPPDAVLINKEGPREGVTHWLLLSKAGFELPHRIEYEGSRQDEIVRALSGEGMLEITWKIVQAGLPRGRRLPQAQAAYGADWDTEEAHFRASAVKTKSGHYMVLKEFLPIE